MGLNWARFDVLTSGDDVTVTYAKQQAGSIDGQHGPGLGFVHKFGNLGTTITRIASHGLLKAPWGSGHRTVRVRLVHRRTADGLLRRRRISARRGDELIGQLRDTANRQVTSATSCGGRPGGTGDR